MAILNCFVIMPFQKEFNSIFDVIQTSVENTLIGEKIRCYWLKDLTAAGKITDDIISSIKECDICIADITASNPNVMWETGYAMALGKPTILIGQKLEEMPFDLKVHRVIKYERNNYPDLSHDLKKAITQTMLRYEIKGKPHVYEKTQISQQIIAITGSGHADRVKISQRIDKLLQPYLNYDILWYCGSSGMVDESSIEYLLGNKKRVVTVAYHRYDFSEKIRRLVDTNKLQYIDASIESLPKGMDGLTLRDKYFCLKADIIILLWDGNSAGTKKLYEYFVCQGKNVLLGFI